MVIRWEFTTVEMWMGKKEAAADFEDKEGKMRTKKTKV